MIVAKSLPLIARYGVAALRRPSTVRGMLGLKGAAFRVPWFSPGSEPSAFPAPNCALAEPQGLLALGGKPSADALLAAFRSGIFVCNQAHQPTKWWSPDPRMVLFPEEIHRQKTLQRLIRNDRFAISFDRAFDDVVDGCAHPRPNSPENWIPLLADTYKALHRRGQAYSIEAWDKDGKLAGGIFGLVSGRHLSVESMFTRVSHASKIALAHLCAHMRHWGYPLIDMQMPTPHLASLGCRPLPREDYLSMVRESIAGPGLPKPWTVQVKPGDDGSPVPLERQSSIGIAS